MPDDLAIQGLGSLFSYGPLGVAVVVEFWYITYLLKERKEMIAAHKVEIAAERSTNASLQDKRLDDQKTLIPLAHSMVTAVEILSEERKK